MKGGKIFAGIVAAALLIIGMVGGAIGFGVLSIFGNAQAQLNSCTATDTVVLPGAITPLQGGEVVIAGVKLKPVQYNNAQIIAGVAFKKGMSVRDAGIGIATSYQEVNLINLDGGDRDSLGLFQQRPSQGWGTPEQIMDEVYASNKFFSALAKVKSRDTLSMMDAAMAVQRPNKAAYRARWKWDSFGMTLAQKFAASQTDTPLINNTAFTQTPVTQTGCTGAGGNVGVAIQAAKSELGNVYRWAAEERPFDDSMLMRWAYAQAGVTIPARADVQLSKGFTVNRPDLVPGDLVFYETASGVTRVAMFLGDDQMLEAPDAQSTVRIVPVRDNGYLGAIRPVQEVSVIPAGTTINGWRIPISGKYVITSGFNPNRYHPVLHRIVPHNGVDLGAPNGTAVLAAHAGIVKSAKWDTTGYGNYVQLTHGDGVETSYGHLSRFAPGIVAGVAVKEGQVIGYVGSTGYSTGNHLHFNVKIAGVYRDPVKYYATKGIRL